MRTVIKILTVCGLMLGAAYGQQKSETVQSILNELNSQPVKAPAAAPAEKAVPAVKPVPAAAVESAPAAKEVAKPLQAADVPAVVEQSREQYIAGDNEAAKQGFERVLAVEPNNPVCTYYLAKMAEKKEMKAEESAMKDVKNGWNGMVFRDYSLSASAKKSLGVSDATDAVEVKGAFPEVSFPKGSYATYRPKLDRLFVVNTQKNIERMESLMASMDAPRQGDAGQVEIKTRFVEFSEGALQELGFNWSDAAGSTYKLAGNNFKIGDGTAQNNLFSDSLRTVPFAQTGALGLGETRASGEWSANRIEDMFNNQAGTLGLKGQIAGNTVDALIKALDQTAGVDVLSTPSVTTLSGQEATITVGERHFFPASYDAGETMGTVLHVKYDDFADKILGVEMKVTPVVKGDEIQMKINPRITELAGWQKFQLAPKDTSYTYYQFRLGMQFDHEAVVAQLPLFNRREVKTEVSVASGSTIGMGGLIGEKTEAFSDRVPVLGSIPLVGRLFRSEGERTVKRNLMIFVTATKVAPNGKLVAERSFEK